MPLTPKGYCDFMKLKPLRLAFQWAEMPLTPKGYCDNPSHPSRYPLHTGPWAEMPLTPKGYCDYDAAECHVKPQF